MTSTRSPSTDTRTRSTTRRIESFRQRFGAGHFYLACHAALPVALTPDLLYSLWANFQQDTHGEAIEVPWIAVADLMLSNLCKEVGHELYEMDGAVRDELLNQLQQDSRFGLERVRELADFVMAYIEQQLDSPDLDTRDLATSQQWRALAYKNPSEAAHTIASALAQLPLHDKLEWMRIAGLVNSLSVPLSAFQPLLNYVRAMTDLARGNLDTAATQMAKAVDANNQVQVEGVNLPIPDAIQGKLPQSPAQETSENSPPSKFGKPMTIAGRALVVALASWLLTSAGGRALITPLISRLSSQILSALQSTPISSATPTLQTTGSVTPTPPPSPSSSPALSPSPSATPPQSVVPKQIPGSPQTPGASQPQPTRSLTSPTDTSVTIPSSLSSALPSNSSIDLLPRSTQSPVPQSSISPSPSILRVGDSGPAVQTLQEQLAQLGYYGGPITGVYDGLTADAVARFQQGFGMQVDGMVGPATLAALRSSIESPTPASTPSNAPSQPPTILVTRINVSGSTVFSARELQAITQPLEGKSITFEELRGAADAITQLYVDRGYATSRAVLPEQTIANGVAVIQVVEGSLERIDVEGTQAVNPDDIRQSVQRGVSVPLNQNDLEAQLQLLQADARFTKVEASLNPGTQTGQSILVIRVAEANSSGNLLFSGPEPPGPGRRMGGAGR